MVTLGPSASSTGVWGYSMDLVRWDGSRTWPLRYGERAWPDVTALRRVKVIMHWTPDMPHRWSTHSDFRRHTFELTDTPCCWNNIQRTNSYMRIWD